jgi:hypothetical protein
MASPHTNTSRDHEGPLRVAVYSKAKLAIIFPKDGKFSFTGI